MFTVNIFLPHPGGWLTTNQALWVWGALPLRCLQNRFQLESQVDYKVQKATRHFLHFCESLESQAIQRKIIVGWANLKQSNILSQADRSGTDYLGQKAAQHFCILFETGQQTMISSNMYLLHWLIEAQIITVWHKKELDQADLNHPMRKIYSTSIQSYLL